MFYLFKWTVSLDFRPLVSVINQPYRPPIKRLKPFGILLHVRRDSRFESRQNRFRNRKLSPET
jgi:hypothetical protein